MAREAVGYRDVVAMLYEHFQKWNISVAEYAEYLGKDAGKVRELITAGKLPGTVNGVQSRKTKREFIIPIASIALFEVRASGKKQ